MHRILRRFRLELAGHYELAGEFAKAIRHLRLAADGAASRFANREAMRHLERAIHLIDKLAEGDRASLRMDLLEQRALMRLSTMDLEGSAEDLAAIDSQAQVEGNVEPARQGFAGRGDAVGISELPALPGESSKKLNY